MTSSIQKRVCMRGAWARLARQFVWFSFRFIEFEIETVDSLTLFGSFARSSLSSGVQPLGFSLYIVLVRPPVTSTEEESSSRTRVAALRKLIPGFRFQKKPIPASAFVHLQTAQARRRRHVARSRCRQSLSWHPHGPRQRPQRYVLFSAVQA
jgi:hypothetical protein